MQAPVRVINQSVESLLQAKRLIEAGTQFADDMACSLAAQTQNEDGEGIKKLKDIMLEFCKLQRDIDQFAEAAKFVVNEAQTTRELTDLESVLNDKLRELQSRSGNFNCRQHKRYLDMEEHIRNKVETDDSELVRNSKQLVQLDDELAVTETEINTKCPVTQQEMKNPVRNRHCNHYYDLSGALELIRNRPQVRCPVAGCKNVTPLKPEDLIDDKQLKKYIEKKNRKAIKAQ